MSLSFGSAEEEDFGGASGIAEKLISGWGINGIGTFQSGFPLHFTTASNLTNSFGGGSRPNVVSGCQAEISGSAQSRISKWFNTSCYTAPVAFTFGNASRVEPKLRAAGMNNRTLQQSKIRALPNRSICNFARSFSTSSSVFKWPSPDKS